MRENLGRQPGPRDLRSGALDTPGSFSGKTPVEKGARDITIAGNPASSQYKPVPHAGQGNELRAKLLVTEHGGRNEPGGRQTATSTLEVIHQPLFEVTTQVDMPHGQPKIRRSVAFHNVSGVVPDAGTETASFIEHHYGPRGGAMDWSQPRLGLAVSEVTPEIAGQAAYLGEVSGKDFRAYTFRELQNGTEPADTMVVPYIHTADTQARVRELGQVSYGLPPRMVHELKNKVRFHERVLNSDVEGFEVPDFKIAEGNDLTGVALQGLREWEALYERHRSQLSRDYPLGVMIRAEESDGNYGSCLVKETNYGGIIVMPDGKIESTVDKPYGEGAHFNKGQWEEALTFAKNYLSKPEVTRDFGNTKFVVSRYIDISSTPGLSEIIKDGHIASLGWNGQIMVEDTTACVGTTPYGETYRDMIEDYFYDDKQKARVERRYNQLRGDHERYEAQTSVDFAAFLEETAADLGYDLRKLSGTANVDIMIPGQLERELRHARKQGPTGNGEGYYVAESNPRWTNYTDAVMAAVGFTRREPTIFSMLDVIKGGITSIDKYRDPYLAEYDIEEAREELLKLNPMAQKDGLEGQAYVRMPDNPPGVIFVGNAHDAERIMQGAIINVARSRRMNPF